MARKVSIAEARNHLTVLIHDVERGKKVELTRRGKRVAVLVSCDEYDRLRATRPSLDQALQAWQKAFAEISQESGYGPGEARRRAEDAVMRIEGSLVLSRVLNDSKPFHRALDELGSTLLQ